MVFAVGAGVAGGVTANELIPTSPYVRGLYVGGELLPPSSELGAWVDRRREEVRARPVTLHFGDQFQTVTYADVGVDLDIQRTLEQAAVIGHQGSLANRVEEAKMAKRGEIDLPLVLRTNPVAAREVVEKIAARFKQEPVDARMDLKGRQKIPDVPGRELDVEDSLAAIGEAYYGSMNGADVVLTTRPLRAKVTVKDLVAVDVSKTLSAHETTYATIGIGVGRSANIARAASLLDGAIVAPGAVLSFNDLVGPRTLDRGFTWAPEIQGDELTTGVGGGTCQVSSTLFNAALFGAMEVVERQSHSRPSAYAKMGLDATVVYDSVDLKIKNPFSFPIMIHAFVPKPGVVRVEILGGDPLADVTYAYGIGHVEDFVRRITVKNHLKPGTRIRRQKGSRGYDVNSIVTIKWRTGATEQRQFFSLYRPAPEVFWVAPGYDERELPPLPEHATGVEGRLYDDASYQPSL